MNNDPEALIAVLSILEEQVDYDESIANATLPCLIYNGEADPHDANTKKSMDELPNATFVTLPGLDHFAGFMRSDLVVPHIQKFLEKNDQDVIKLSPPSTFFSRVNRRVIAPHCSFPVTIP